MDQGIELSLRHRVRLNLYVPLCMPYCMYVYSILRVHSNKSSVEAHKAQQHNTRQNLLSRP